MGLMKFSILHPVSYSALFKTGDAKIPLGIPRSSSSLSSLFLPPHTLGFGGELLFSLFPLFMTNWEKPCVR